MLAQVFAYVVFALPDARTAIAKPCAGLVDNAGLHAKVDDFAFAGDARTVHDVELGLLEGRCHLVLDDLHAGFVANDFVVLLDGAVANDIVPDRRKVLGDVTACGRFWVVEHDADLHANLVDEDVHGVGTLDGGRELAQGLAHEARLQTRQRVAHITFDFGLGRERRHRVDNDEVDGGRAHQRVGDFESLLARIGLGDQQVFKVDAQLRSVLNIKRMLGVDKGARTAQLLHFGNDLKRERGFARRFRAVDFNDSPPWQAADAQRNIEPQRAGGHHLYVVLDLVVAITHDRTLAELLFNLGQGGGERFSAFGAGFAGFVVHLGSLRMTVRRARRTMRRCMPAIIESNYTVYIHSDPHLP